MPIRIHDCYQPQLSMKLDDLSNLPEVCLPGGYFIRHYQPGDDGNWNKIIYASFEVPEEKRDGWFEHRIKADPAFRADRVFFVVRGEEAVGTATAWQVSGCPSEIGYLHYVGVLPSERGKRLGYHVSLAALHKMVEEGRKAAVLLTDDFRIPAIKTYLGLGFRPVLVHENQRTRWREIFLQIGRSDLIEEFSTILNGPIMKLW